MATEGMIQVVGTAVTVSFACPICANGAYIKIFITFYAKGLLKSTGFNPCKEKNSMCRG